MLIRTSDGRTVHLPNDDVLRNPLINNSESLTRRSQVEVRLQDGADLDVARSLAAVAGGVDGVLADPAPESCT